MSHDPNFLKKRGIVRRLFSGQSDGSNLLTPTYFNFYLSPLFLPLSPNSTLISKRA